MNLDLVLGMSCHNIGSLACDQNSGLVAHTASGVLVILNTRTNCQVKYFHVRKNCVSSASFSQDGRYVTTGETGFRPAVRVWRLKDGKEVATLCGHEFGIKCVQFSPNQRQIISVGMEHDNVVNVWAWPTGQRLAANNIVDVVKAVTYSECGTYFVTAGSRHIKFWYPGLTQGDSTHNRDFPAVQPLYGRPGLLGDCKDHTFIDVASGTGASAATVFAITRAGGLVIISAKDRKVKGHKNIDGVKGTCIKAHDRVLFIGFDTGDIHMFNATTLVHLGALPVPTFFRRTGLNGGGVFTLTFNLCTSFLTSAYKNSSLCVWDMQDAANVKQKYVAVYHSDAIACLDFYSSRDPHGPGVRETLVTVSNDATVRLWGVLINKTVCYDRLSVFSSNGGSKARTEGSSPRKLVESGVITTVKISPDRKCIVTGNQAGSICVYDKESLRLITTVTAHSRDVTCLDFYSDTIRGHLALVSGSRDRLVQVMDATSNYRIVTSLPVHSSSITAVRTCRAGNRICVLSTAADRLVNLSSSCIEGETPLRRLPGFQLTHCMPCVSSATDIAIDQNTQEVAVGFQDGNIRVMELSQLQERRVFPGCTANDAQVKKIELDRWAALLLSAASDKTINVINFHNGQILHTVTGHNKSVTGLVFTSNGDHVISTSLDGCVFLWRLTPELLVERQEIYRATRSGVAALGGPAVRPSASLGSFGDSNLLKEDRLQRVAPFTLPRAKTELPIRDKGQNSDILSVRRRGSGPRAAVSYEICGGRKSSHVATTSERLRKALPEVTGSKMAAAGAAGRGSSSGLPHPISPRKSKTIAHFGLSRDTKGGLQREPPILAHTAESRCPSRQQPDGDAASRAGSEKRAEKPAQGEESRGLAGTEEEKTNVAGLEQTGGRLPPNRASRRDHLPGPAPASNRKLTTSLGRRSPSKPRRHTWRSLVNTKRTEDLDTGRQNVTRFFSV